MAVKEHLGMIPLMIETRTIRSRHKPAGKAQRGFEFGFAALFAGLGVWHLATSGFNLWFPGYIFAAILSLLPVRSIPLLWLTGTTATACGFGFFVVSGIASQDPNVTMLSKDTLGLLAATLWFGLRFIKDLRETKVSDRIGASYEFINLRKLQR